MRRAGSFAAWAAALFGALYALRKKPLWVKALAVAVFLAVAVVIGSLLSNAAVTNIYYVDKDSRGGTCSDSYTEAQARNSPSHPFCIVDAADSVVPSGAYIRVRGGSYPDWKIDAAKSSTTTITPYRGETVTTTGIWFSAAAKWSISGVEVTGTDGTTPPGTDTGRVLVDASSNIALGNLNVHGTVQGVRLVNGSSNVKVEGGTFEDLSCSRFAADGGTCGSNDEGSGVSADASITGLTVRGVKFVDDEGEAVESGIGATEALNRADELTRNTDRTGTWTVADLGATSFDSAYNSVTNGTTKVFRVSADKTGLPDPLISSTAKTAGTRVVFLATSEHNVTIDKLFPRDGGSYATFEDFKVGTFYIRRSTGATMRDISVSLNDTSPLPGSTFTPDGTSTHSQKNIWFVKGATDASIIGGDTGPNYIWDDYDAWLEGCGSGDVGGDATAPSSGDDCDTGAAIQIDCYPSCPTTATTNLLIAGHRFHDFSNDKTCRGNDGVAAGSNDEDCGDGHADCIHWFSGSGTIRGNTFDGCWVTDILPVKTTDLTIENNLFKPQTPSWPGESSPTSNSFSGTCGSNTHTNLTIRNNTWLGTTSLTMTTGPCFTNALIYDNAMEKINTANNACTHAGITWTNNKAAAEFSGTCGNSGKIQITGGNQLNSSTGAPNRGSLLVNSATGTPPSFDHDGFARPFGASADIGAFEYPVR